ncbi:MAG: non-ribosomal peptide synthase/amino acid adenylation enzyme, partial [bacterium]
DGWSMNIFLEEMCSFYQSFISGQPSSFKPLSIQYLDYALWQRDRLSGEVLEKEFKYWEKKLSGIKPLHSLPIDKPRPTNQTHYGRQQQIVVSKEISQKVVSLSKKANVTLFMTMLASFKLLLYRYSGELDIIVGSPIAGRNHPETEDLIGFFVNTLVLRTSFSANNSFLGLLEKVRETCLEAYTHQEIPFEKLVELLQPERSLSYSPIFQVMFLLQEDNLSAFNLNGLELSYFDIETNIVKFDLTCFVARTSNGLEVSLTYNTSLFEDETITRMLENYQVLLESLIDNPSQRISTLPILSDKEQSMLLKEFNQTDVSYPKGVFIHQLFEKQVALTPNSIAVSFEDKSLTYQQLNEKANQLARKLIKLGAKAEVLIGICLERSLNLIIALLAILKSEAGYVPLDPSYPIERLAFMVEDSKVSILIIENELAVLFSINVIKVLLSKELDGELKEFEQESNSNIFNKALADNLAYVIYTSGSTGRPKGVLISHSSICNYLLWMKSYYPLTQESSILQTTSLSFDVSVREIFWPLISGARLVLPLQNSTGDTRYIVDMCLKHNITDIRFVPSMLKVFLEEEHLEHCKSLQRVFCGGEAMPVELEEQFFSKLQAELNNTYGPTETSVNATVWNCNPTSKKQRVPIGQPIANTKTYILDE